MLSDNGDTVAAGADVSFPENGIIFGTSITRLNDSTFNLCEIGAHQVFFQVPASEAGQLQLTLNASPLPTTVVGRATGTTDIIGMSIVETNLINSI